jgi:hypothetical protein
MWKLTLGYGRHSDTSFVVLDVSLKQIVKSSC